MQTCADQDVPKDLELHLQMTNCCYPKLVLLYYAFRSSAFGYYQWELILPYFCNGSSFILMYIIVSARQNTLRIAGLRRWFRGLQYRITCQKLIPGKKEKTYGFWFSWSICNITVGSARCWAFHYLFWNIQC